MSFVCQVRLGSTKHLSVLRKVIQFYQSYLSCTNSRTTAPKIMIYYRCKKLRGNKRGENQVFLITSQIIPDQVSSPYFCVISPVNPPRKRHICFRFPYVCIRSGTGINLQKAIRSANWPFIFLYYLFNTLSSNTAYLSPYTLIICCSPQAHSESKMLFKLHPYSLSSYSTFGGT